MLTSAYLNFTVQLEIIKSVSLRLDTNVCRCSFAKGRYNDDSEIIWNRRNGGWYTTHSGEHPWGREYEHRTSLLSIFILTMKRENGRCKQTDSDTCATSYRIIRRSSSRYFTCECFIKSVSTILLVMWILFVHTYMYLRVRANVHFLLSFSTMLHICFT